MKIVFDNFVDRYDDHYKWSAICPSCAKKYKVSVDLLDGDGEGVCGVKGCNNEADYYIDFPDKEMPMEDNCLVFEF